MTYMILVGLYVVMVFKCCACSYNVKNVYMCKKITAVLKVVESSDGNINSLVSPSHSAV